jgi:hypothetical protein
MVTPELSDLSATWISDNKATGVSSITLQLRGNISDTSIFSCGARWRAALGDKTRYMIIIQIIRDIRGYFDEGAK